jgi:hypothetical protein
MDVQADHTNLQPGPATGGVRQAPATSAGPIVYAQGATAYSDTAPTPIVGRQAAPPVGSSRWLRVTVVIVAIAVVGAGAALAVEKSGVLTSTPAHTGSATPPPTHTTSSPSAPLVTQIASGPGTASYTVAVQAYHLTVVTGPGRSWVSVGAVGQKPAFEGILEPGTSKDVVLLGPSQLNIGAGGTSVVVKSNHRTVTLKPPSAPFSYNFTPA